MPFDRVRSGVAKSSRVGLASCLLIASLLGQVTPAASAPPDPLPAGVVFEPNLEYAVVDDQHLQLNLARPRDGEGPFPAVVCIHGGGFRAGSRDSFDELCVQLAQHGYVAVTVSYRLAPKYQFPAALHDVKAAVRWLRANAAKYHIDPDRIGTTGASAGGTLAQMLGVTSDVSEFEGAGGNRDQSSRVACVVNVYGANDFTRSYEASVDAAEVLPLFLGGNLQRERQRHIRASPLYWVTPHAAPTLCIHGTRDAYVAYDQSKWLVERLQAAGVEAELMTIPDGDHGFRTSSPETKADIERRRLAFFDDHLKPR
ncbi:MAG: alpha/beta hydrolase [Pirellulales bacterium]